MTNPLPVVRRTFLRLLAAGVSALALPLSSRGAFGQASDRGIGGTGAPAPRNKKIKIEDRRHGRYRHHPQVWQHRRQRAADHLCEERPRPDRRPRGFCLAIAHRACRPRGGRSTRRHLFDARHRCCQRGGRRHRSRVREFSGRARPDGLDWRSCQRPLGRRGSCGGQRPAPAGWPDRRQFHRTAVRNSGTGRRADRSSL